MKSDFRFFQSLALLLIAGIAVQAQTFTNKGIGTATPHQSAVLDVHANDKGLLLPRLTQAQRNGIANPAAGLALYNTNINRFNYYDGSVWRAFPLWFQNGMNVYYHVGAVSVGTNVVAINPGLTVKDELAAINASNATRFQAGVFAQQSGYSAFYGPNGNRNVYIASKDTTVGFSTPNYNQGYAAIYNETEDALVELSTTGQGFAGFVAINDTGGNYMEILTQSVAGSGYFGMDGINGNRNTVISSLVGYPNNGFVSLRDDAGNQQASVYVDNLGLGVVNADIKNFNLDHPEDPGKEIWYASIEGPEAAAYLRGTATLTDGRGEIVFPHHFQHVINAEGMTVMLTPLSAQSKGLAVTGKSPEGFEVQELLSGQGSYPFDWEVKAVRKGFENYRVIRDKSESRAEGMALTR